MKVAGKHFTKNDLQEKDNAHVFVRGRGSTSWRLQLQRVQLLSDFLDPATIHQLMKVQRRTAHQHTLHLHHDSKCITLAPRLHHDFYSRYTTQRTESLIPYHHVCQIYPACKKQQYLQCCISPAIVYVPL